MGFRHLRMERPADFKDLFWIVLNLRQKNEKGKKRFR